MHNTRSSVLPMVALSLAVGIARPAHAQYAILSLQSQPGEYIGLGHDYNILYTPQNSAYGYLGATVTQLTAAGLPSVVEFNFLQAVDMYNDSNDAGLYFDTSQLGVPLLPGKYTDAQQAVYASPGHPGIFIGFQGRANGNDTGSFAITDATFTPNAAAMNGFQVDAFDATFTEQSAGVQPGTIGTLTGSLSYRANGSPPAVPEPSSFALLGLGLLPVGFALRARRQKPSA